MLYFVVLFVILLVFSTFISVLSFNYVLHVSSSSWLQCSVSFVELVRTCSCLNLHGNVLWQVQDVEETKDPSFSTMEFCCSVTFALADDESGNSSLEGYRFQKTFKTCFGFVVHVLMLHFLFLVTLICFTVSFSSLSVVVVLDLIVLGLVIKTKTDASRSRSCLSSYITTTATTSSMPSQPADSFCYRHLKTDSDYYYYLRHFGYCLRHFGYFLDTVTISWVTVTLIALGNLKLKNSSSCCLHVLMNIGLDLIQSLPCVLTHIGFLLKISLALDVWSSLLRERRSSETVFRSEWKDWIGKNWWRYYNLYDLFLFFMILQNFCKVSDFLNRLFPYMY